jgi:hypothetical protein
MRSTTTPAAKLLPAIVGNATTARNATLISR